MGSVLQQWRCGEARGVARGELATDLRRRQMLLGGAVTLLGLWAYALGPRELSASGSPAIEALVVGATSTSAGFASSCGERLARQQPDAQCSVRLMDDPGCISALAHETADAALLTHPMSYDDGRRLARHHVPVVLITTNPAASGAGRTGDVHYLYVREDLLSTRPCLRTFVGICRGDSGQENPGEPWNGPGKNGPKEYAHEY